jgi:hypothetical protein
MIALTRGAAHTSPQMEIKIPIDHWKIKPGGQTVKRTSKKSKSGKKYSELR